MRTRRPDLVPASLAGLTATALTGMPSIATACATCMNDPVRTKTVPILLGFIGVPFLVAGGVYLVLRQVLKK